MKTLNQNEMNEISGGISFGKLIGSAAVGAIGGALRGIAGGPVGMISGAIFGAGMGMASCSIMDATTLYEQNKLN